MRIALVVNQVAGGWLITDPETWGGGEETIAGFARALARRGNQVTLYYDGPMHAEQHGTGLLTCAPRGLAPADGARGAFDISLYFKAPEFAGLNLAQRQFVWTDQERAFDPDPFTGVVLCSDYLRRWLTSLQPRVEPRTHVIGYGLDVDEVLAAGVGVSRDTKLVLHTASPDRGLEELLRLWPSVHQAVPDARLVCSYGWELFDRMGGSRDLKAKLERLLAESPATTFRRYTRAEVHALYHQARVYAYFCTGGEQYGLAIRKAILAGCMPIVRPWGALHEALVGYRRCETAGEMQAALIETLRADPPTLVGPPETRSGRIPDWDTTCAAWEALWASADEPAAFVSHLKVTPDTPPFHQPVGWNLPLLIQGPVQEWLGRMRPQRPWLDPALGLGTGPAPSPQESDAVLLGFTIEDDPRAVAETLRAIGVPAGVPLLVLVSTGTWRADTRYRVLEPADLGALFKACPEYEVRGLVLDQELNGVLIATCRYVPDRIGTRDVRRALTVQNPRQTLSVRYIARDAAQTFALSLESVAPIADQVCIIDTGSVDRTADVVEDFQRRHRSIEVVYAQGTSPRFCHDCLSEHALGQLYPGHRVAGFETPRNESLNLGQPSDWDLWIDCDEELLNAQGLVKYLKPSIFAGFSLQQHHHSCDPPDLKKVDFPVRLYRRVPDPDAPRGVFPFGEHAWPTVGTGLTVRFAGIVHEHPGLAPSYVDGVGPAIILSDVHIAHRGYYLESQRRSRFSRNWPLMVADRQKYPGRRLGQFLELRDLSHHVRYQVEQNGGRLTPETAQLAEEGRRIFKDHFLDAIDPYIGDALLYSSVCAQVLGHGIDVEVLVKARKPELAGTEEIGIQFQGRFDQPEDILKALTPRLKDLKRWLPPFV